ncbi:DNA-binding transcriptional regulator, LysR family [Rhizobium sp. NFR07]|nr:LysR family transcriptional regulator [Rhizobium sp. NFR07]SFB65161.1 DNA-binding transcriptional regulator, LysR family [Rhizobium sp. NFR07]
MELRHLRYFIAVAEEGNFRRAAERIGIAQPPLSSQIKDLEDELEVQLFRRLPRGAALTEAGEAFLAEVIVIFRQVEFAKQMALRGAAGEFGRLRIGFTGSAAFNELVPKIIRSFRKAYPSVALTLAELNTRQLLDQIRSRSIDAAFIRPGPTSPDGIKITMVAEEPMMVVLPTGHRLAKEYAIPLSSLQDEPLVLHSRELGPDLYDEVIEGFRRSGVDPVIGQIAPQITSIANLVAVELGVSIVPAPLSAINVPGVVFLPIIGDAPRARLAVATHPDDHSVVTRNFKQQVATNLQKR